MKNEQLNELALFAGAGGGILGGHLLGWRTVCAVEFAAYPRSVLLARQRDGMLPLFPVWDDVRTFDGKPWRGSVDVISGGFPCQDISVAGKGDGLDGERSGLWSEMARIIGEVQPRFAFVENSPMLTSRGLDRVLADLSTLGYDAEWGVVGADDAGAPHRRERIWILAYANNYGHAPREGCNGSSGSQQGTGWAEEQSCVGQPSGSDTQSEVSEDLSSQHPIGQLADPDVFGRLHGQAEERTASGGIHAQREPEPSGEDVADTDKGRCKWTGSAQEGKPNANVEAGREAGSWWATEPSVRVLAHGLAPLLGRPETASDGDFLRVATGVPKRADRLKSLGNGQVPAAAALAWHTLYARIQQRS